METKEIKTLDDLKAVAKQSFVVLKPNRNSKGKFNISLEMDSYIELHCFMLDLIKVSIMALDAEQESMTKVKSPCSAIRGVLEILLQLVPLEEAELLDTVHELVLDEGEVMSVVSYK